VNSADWVRSYVTVASAIRVIGSPNRLIAWASQKMPKSELRLVTDE
jgi:hypothetical protein